MSTLLVFLNKFSDLPVTVKLGDNNMIYINDISYSATAFRGDNDLLHIRTEMCPIFVEDPQDDNEFKANMNCVELVLDTTTSLLHSSSHISYFYNKENSFIERYKTPILSEETFSSVNKYIKAGFNEEISVSGFVSYLYQNAADIEHTLSLFLEESLKYGALKTKLPSVSPLKANYSFKLIRVDQNSSEFGELLTRFYLESKNCSPQFETVSSLKDIIFQDEAVDVFIAITDQTISSDTIPSTKIVWTVPTGLISMGRTVIKKLNELLVEVEQKSIKERVYDTSLFKGDSGEGEGCCGGNKDGGGCCKTEKKKDCEPSLSFDCTEEDCCSKPKKVNKCCKGKEENDCCKTSGNGSCSCTDCGNKCS